ncbi:MAG: DUF4105 domain-containing protein [Muribaculaceae bacterium]|nr:DUF4105 domain-containing protein [Muribaculaceae bacterium]
MRLLVSISAIVLSSLLLHAQDEDTSFVLLPDSSNFVTASMIVASPGEALYSQLGHAALRMECPRYRLDYCFSFEEEPGVAGVLKFFFGKTNAHMWAVPTDQFLDVFKKEGRQVMQYTLNLTLHEKQELWRILDLDYVDTKMRHFNFLQNNCSSVSLQSVENVFADEAIDFKGWPEQFKMNNGEQMRYYTRNTSWLQFICTSFSGTESDVSWRQEDRMSPELLPQVLKMAVIVDSVGNQRPLVTSEQELLPLVNKFKASPVTPLWVFGILLLVTVLITLAQLKWKLRWLPKALDILLMALVTIAGVVLIYTSYVSGLFGIHWNWYLIPFNPLPLIIWLVWRKRKGFYKIYLFYVVVLVLFILATPLSQQLDMPHQLITASLTVRCLYHYLTGKVENESLKLNIKKNKK